MTETFERRRAKSAVAWGVVGALGFLVLHQAYLLVGGAFLGVGPVAVLAVVVFAVATTVMYLAEGRVAAPPVDEAGNDE